ncbi:energy transducer TonB [Flavobacterium pectinovorum]|uniref:TonB C-terminal domain-containing protein n=1 Tax=Flavobacterium pectinovorum TaxID=29533 RepID=A0A502F5W6_9FLAO|nr:energy transducer TonB [Flavobacterium pectinovorum]TPG44051.1 hypothetical protein EAH81_05730 [Flavobacterium pectinovorum]
MKIKLSLFFILLFIAFSCKNENTKNDPDFKPAKSTTKTSVADSLKSDSVIVDSDANDSENTKMLLDFYIKNDKKAQFFLINTSRDTTIVCAEKTRIRIEANSFISSKTGKSVIGQIKISVKEYYTISDILMGRLSTISNGKLLETGGMLNINAVSNGENCELKKDKNIEIEFPRKVEKEGMQLFNGNWKNNEINWSVAANSVDLNHIFTKVDEKPVYPGGLQKMYSFIGNNIRLPDDYINGKVYTRFVIDKEGNVKDIQVTKGIRKDVDDAVIKGLQKLPKFIPGKVNGVAVNTTYNLPITIKQEDEDVRSSSVSSAQKYVKPLYDDKTLKNADTESIQYYLLRSSKLGMINCDRFWNYDESPKIDFVINLKTDAKTSVNVIFHRFKSVMRGFSADDTILFNNIPSGEKITIFAIKYFYKKPFLAVKETEISSKIENDLVFQEVTFEKLKNETEKLNRIN